MSGQPGLDPTCLDSIRMKKRNCASTSPIMDLIIPDDELEVTGTETTYEMNPGNVPKVFRH